MLSIERVDSIGHFLTEFDKWTVHEMILTPDKLQWYWEEFQKYPSLFSDLTKGQVDLFVNAMTAQGTFWMEVYDATKLVGLLYLTDLSMITDCTCHIMFFDRRLMEKVPLCRHVVRWCFSKFHLHRMSAVVPDIYHATVRLTRGVGFKQEGIKRDAALVGGKWINEIQFGLLAAEMY